MNSSAVLGVRIDDSGGHSRSARKVHTASRHLLAKLHDGFESNRSHRVRHTCHASRVSVNDIFNFLESVPDIRVRCAHTFFSLPNRSS